MLCPNPSTQHPSTLTGRLPLSICSMSGSSCSRVVFVSYDYELLCNVFIQLDKKPDSTYQIYYYNKNRITLEPQSSRIHMIKVGRIGLQHRTGIKKTC